MKGEKTATARKGLTDITNSQQPPPPKVPFTPTSKSYVEMLLQENAALIKLIEERECDPFTGMMVEVTGAELNKLRINFRKAQAQNSSLAKSNTQLLTELNAVKDKLRALQHQLMCKNAVLKVKSTEHQAKVQTHHLSNGSQEEEVESTKPSCEQITANKPSIHSRRHNQRSQSLGASSTCDHEVEKLKVQNRRHSLRRQSGRFQSQVPEPEENLFEIEEAKFHICRPVVDIPKPDQKSKVPCSSPKKEGKTCSSPKKEGKENNGCSANYEQGVKRSSIARPLRRAAEKVQSYKEIPLNVKMRRLE